MLCKLPRADNAAEMFCHDFLFSACILTLTFNCRIYLQSFFMVVLFFVNIKVERDRRIVSFQSDKHILNASAGRCIYI